MLIEQFFAAVESDRLAKIPGRLCKVAEGNLAVSNCRHYRDEHVREGRRTGGAR